MPSPGLFDDAGQLSGRGLLALVLDGHLADAVVAGVVGEGRMVNQEIARSGRLEPTAHLAVELLQGRLQFAVIKRVFVESG